MGILEIILTEIFEPQFLIILCGIIIVICIIRVNVKFAPNVGICPTASDWLVFSLFNKIIRIKENKDQYNDDAYCSCLLIMVLFCKIQRYYSNNNYVVCRDSVSLINPTHPYSTYKFTYDYIYIQKDIYDKYEIMDIYESHMNADKMEHNARILARKILYDYTKKTPYVRGSMDKDHYLNLISNEFRKSEGGRYWKLSHLSLATPSPKPTNEVGSLNVVERDPNKIKKLLLIIAIILTSVNILYYLIDLMKG